MFKRKDDETFLTYISRISEYAKEKKITYKEWGDLVLGSKNTYGEDNCRKGFYVVSKLLEVIPMNEFEVSDNIEQMEYLEELLDTIEKEKMKKSDKVREYKKLLREQSRYENLLECFRETIQDYFFEEVRVIPYKAIERGVERVYGVLQLSDWHCGKIIDNEFNFYDVDTMIDRANDLKNKVLNRCEKDNVTNLIIEINGDMVDGMIHISSRVEQEENVIQQCVTITNVLASMINDMKKHFSEIKVLTTLGNHGRITSDKTKSSTHENFEMLIPVMLRDKLGRDISVIDSKGKDFISYEFDDKFIVVSHGQNDKITSVVSDFAKIYKRVPNEIHLGHFHEAKVIKECGCYVVVNGSLCGTDDYALTIRKDSNASQILTIYDGDTRIHYELNV